MGTLVTMEEKRQFLCLEVAWEIDAMARVLPDLVPNTDEATGIIFWCVQWQGACCVCRMS